MLKRLGSAVAVLLAGGLIAGAFASTAVADAPGWNLTTLQVHSADQYGISCWSDLDCMTVGYNPDYYGGTSVQSVGGRVVSVHELSAYASIDCHPSSCVSIGGELSPSSQSWTGGRWSKPKQISVGTRRGELSVSDFQSISCPSRRVCYASGSTFSFSTSAKCQKNNAPASCLGASNEVAMLRGGRWHVVLRVNVALSGAGGVLGFASSGTVSFARALATAEQEVLIGTAPPTIGSDSSFGPISCSSVGHCVLVGTSFTAHGSRVFADTLRGGRWHPRTIRSVGEETELALRSIACSSGSSCVAVGTEITRGLRQLALVDIWNGHRWSSRLLGVPHSLRGESLASVSCSRARVCMAVGSGASTGGRPVPVSELLAGSRWTSLPTPVPKHSRYRGGSGLVGVSCPSSRACTAVGDYAGRLPGWFLEHYHH